MKMNYEYRGKKEKKIEHIQKQIRVKELELIKTPKISHIQSEIIILQQQLQIILLEEIQKNKIHETEIFCRSR